MTFHAYFQYVCLFIVWLCAIAPTMLYAQKYRQQSDTHRLKDPDYGKEAEPAAKTDEGNGKSDILII